MRKRDLPSKQLLPDSSSYQQQESPDLFLQQQQSIDYSSLQQQSQRDLHLQQQSSNLGSLEQDEAWSLPQQNQTSNFQEQYTSNVEQQPISYTQRDFHLQQQSSNLGSLEQDEAWSLPQQNEQYMSNVEQQPISYTQGDFHLQQQSSNLGSLEQDEAWSLPQQNQTSNFQEQYTSNVEQQPISYLSSNQHLYLYESQQPSNLYVYQPPIDMFLQQPSYVSQQPSYVSQQQQNQARTSLSQQQNVISDVYITGQQQDFHYQTHQQNPYIYNPNPTPIRYQSFSHNLESSRQKEQSYSHRVLDSDQQLISTSHLRSRRRKQNTHSQLHQASCSQHQVWDQQSGSQMSQNLSNRSSNLVQQSALSQQIRPVSLQQQQRNFSHHERKSQQQKIRDQHQRWPHQQKIQTQSHQYFEAKMDTQTQVVEQDNYKENILFMLSQLTLNQTCQETEITQKISSTMKYYQACIPKRQNVNKAGTLGTSTSVLTNMFKIKFDKNFVTVAIHYDVDITSTISSKFSKALYRKVFEQCRKEHFINRHPAFDGIKNAYSAKDLPFGNRLETDIKIQDCKKQCQKICDKHVKLFKIILNKVADIDLNWIKKLQPGLEADQNQTSIQALDIIMRHEPEFQHINIGRSLFWDLEKDNEKKTDLTGGLNLERGGFLSVVLGWQMYLNVDVVHKGFITAQKVADLIIKLCREMKTIDTKESYNKISKFLKGVKVIYKIPQSSGSSHSTPRSRTYHLNGLGLSANEHRFPYNGSNITIKNYFANRYKYILDYPNLPCLSVGAQGREIYLPAELCTIVAGQSVKKLNKTQTSKMIREAAENASNRRQRIKEAFKKINVNDSLTMRKEFRVSVDTEMQKVNARILEAPILKYDAAEVFVSNGKWFTRNHFVQPMNLGKEEWTIINLDKPSYKFAHRDMCTFMEKLIWNASSVGMKIEKPNTSNFKSLNPENIEEIRNYFMHNKKLKLIIVVISNSPDTIYNKIKQITELELGVLTQCIKYQNICETKNTTLKNILLKINAKLNGINHTLHTIPKCFANSCMLVGADVTHPSHDENTPSIAAVTASCDSFGFQYNVVLKLLQSKDEIILDLEKIIQVQLLIYQKKMSHLPERLIYYRDGVSEGQFPQVIHYEIQAIKRACMAYKADIQITCLVVQKRHHVRFFPTNDQLQNVKAGTIVDTEITHPSHIDFYLVSHESIRGTARPTKYRCIWNESNYTEDEIEELTYYLCHMYARCMKTVSYPAPTYYAHLAAYRGKVLIQGRDLDNLEEVQRKFNKNMIHSPMYFV